MAETKKTSYRKAIIIGALVAVGLFLIPYVLAAAAKENDWKVINDFVMVYPSVFKGISLSGWAIPVAIVGALIAGYGAGFGSQDQLFFSVGGSEAQQAKNDAIVAVSIIALGLLFILLGFFAIPSNGRSFTHVTMTQKEFNPDKAGIGGYDDLFTDMNQADPVYNANFSRK